MHMAWDLLHAKSCVYTKMLHADDINSRKCVEIGAQDPRPGSKDLGPGPMGLRKCSFILRIVYSEFLLEEYYSML